MINRFDNLINELNKDKPMSVVRLGNVESTQLLFMNGSVYNQMRTNAGWFGDEEDMKDWRNKMYLALTNADCNLRVISCPSFYVADDVLTKLNLFIPTLPYLEDIAFWITMINTLRTNNLCFVSYFGDEMQNRTGLMRWIFPKGGIKKKATEWKFVTTENTIEGNEPEYEKWNDILQGQFDRCIAQRADIYFLSCGAYGIPLCNMLKNAGKKAIYVGGFLQLIFGLKGSRWDDRKIIKQYYNKHWIYPTKVPKNADKVEGWCYGKGSK
jgi:hypothetical protein